ncbi:RNA pyrophosphohydrolase [Campylobacter avium]|uniref:RNA pyrophosphohydrolase n=1 Tax=Campylobacter avium TaxID=522485 RepID=UPI00255B5E48|nr:RNA pyrophosphohydrolase [Campylobacter avium]
MLQDKKYRLNVAAVILSSSYPFDCRVFIAKRNDMDDVWQFPQGGIDENENPKSAILRELEEEIGTKDVEFIATYPKWLNYDFPSKIAQKMYPYDGQSQKYFLLRLRPNAKINLRTKHPEFSSYKFVNLQELFKIITHFKRPLYVKVIKYFQEKGYI